jgi:hypothetical protein
MMNSKLLVFGAIAVAAIALIVMTVVPDGTDLPVKHLGAPAPQPGAVANVADSALQNDAERQRSAGAQAQARVPAAVDMAREFATAGSLRAFVERAKQMPDKGGLMFSRFALVFCENVQSTVVDPTIGQWITSPAYKDKYPNPSATLDAMRNLAQRCDGFTEADYAQKDQLQEGRANDPLLAAYTRLSSVEGRRLTFEQKKEDLAILLRSAAMPAVELQMLSNPQLPPVYSGGTPWPVVYFNGRPFGGYSAEAFGAAMLAWSIGGGQQGGWDSLGGRTLDSLYRCALGHCDGGDPLAQALSILAKDPVGKQQATELYSQLAATLRAGNVDAFAPPKGS